MMNFKIYLSDKTFVFIFGIKLGDTLKLLIPNLMNSFKVINLNITINII